MTFSTRAKSMRRLRPKSYVLTTKLVGASGELNATICMNNHRTNRNWIQKVLLGMHKKLLMIEERMSSGEAEAAIGDGRKDLRPSVK